MRSDNRIDDIDVAQLILYVLNKHDKYGDIRLRRLLSRVKEEIEGGNLDTKYRELLSEELQDKGGNNHGNNTGH